MADKVIEETLAPFGDPVSPDEVSAPRRSRARLAGVTPTELISLFGSPALFVLIFVVFALWLGGDFYNSSLRMLEFSQAVPAMVITLGVVVCLSVGQFDLSIAYNASLCGFVVIGLFYRNDVPIWAAILLTLLLGSVVGLVNGLLVTKMHINAFIATLGTGGVLLGLGRVYSDGGQAITPSPTDHPLPPWFRDYLGSFQYVASTPVAVGILLVLVAALLHTINGRALPSSMSRPVRVAILAAVAAVVLGGVAVSGILERVSLNVVIFLALATGLWILMTYTTFGRNIYAVGSNPRAAGYAGISVAKHTTMAFVLAGLMAAVAGIMLSAAQGSAIQGAADGFLLPAYAGAFLATVLISRGRFHIWGAVAGSVGLIYVASGLVAGGVAYTWADVINGAVLIGAVALSSVVRRSR
ncbi:ABC transporter permease [Nocardioides immobilis]|uniref:ABC transporter permease n=1 Tax=Nocardioides immobilis TaxID=2049295 RepID=A0A417Y107_9ACTN|nr:ABC transporter permease [Nocardioides immobilis]RHW26247.1 ABC transporter permease [Nocardioides immobilis]